MDLNKHYKNNPVILDPFYKDSFQYFYQGFNTVGISPHFRDIALAGDSGIAILDMENPTESPLNVHINSQWRVVNVEWCPHKTQDGFVASTFNQTLLVWNFAVTSKKPVYFLNDNMGSSTDFNWSPFDPNLILTSSVDPFIRLWDLRTSKKPVFKFTDWNVTSSIEFSKTNEYCFVSGYQNSANIWDTRLGSRPLISIKNAHDSTIYSVSTHSTKRNTLITAANDKTVKKWDWTYSNDDYLSFTYFNEKSISKARYMPSGNGFVVTFKDPEGGLSLYVDDEDKPIHQVGENNGSVLEFVWRSRGDYYPSNNIDFREWQLISIGADSFLHTWSMPESLVQKLSTRKGHQIKRKKLASINQGWMKKQPTFTNPYLGIIYGPNKNIKDFDNKLMNGKNRHPSQKNITSEFRNFTKSKKIVVSSKESKGKFSYPKDNIFIGFRDSQNLYKDIKASLYKNKLKKGFTRQNILSKNNLSINKEFRNLFYSKKKSQYSAKQLIKAGLNNLRTTSKYNLQPESSPKLLNEKGSVELKINEIKKEISSVLHFEKNLNILSVEIPRKPEKNNIFQVFMNISGPWGLDKKKNTSVKLLLKFSLFYPKKPVMVKVFRKTSNSTISPKHYRYLNLMILLTTNWCSIISSPMLLCLTFLIRYGIEPPYISGILHNFLKYNSRMLLKRISKRMDSNFFEKPSINAKQYENFGVNIARSRSSFSKNFRFPKNSSYSGSDLYLGTTSDSDSFFDSSSLLSESCTSNDSATSSELSKSSSTDILYDDYSNDNYDSDYQFNDGRGKINNLIDMNQIDSRINNPYKLSERHPNDSTTGNSFHNVKSQNSNNVPFPRLCGGVFSGNNKLVLFFASLYTPSTYPGEFGLFLLNPSSQINDNNSVSLSADDNASSGRNFSTNSIANQKTDTENSSFVADMHMLTLSKQIRVLRKPIAYQGVDYYKAMVQLKIQEQSARFVGTHPINDDEDDSNFGYKNEYGESSSSEQKRQSKYRSDSDNSSQNESFRTYEGYGEYLSRNHIKEINKSYGPTNFRAKHSSQNLKSFYSKDGQPKRSSKNKKGKKAINNSNFTRSFGIKRHDDRENLFYKEGINYYSDNNGFDSLSRQQEYRISENSDKKSRLFSIDENVISGKGNDSEDSDPLFNNKGHRPFSSSNMMNNFDSNVDKAKTRRWNALDDLDDRLSVRNNGYYESGIDDVPRFYFKSGSLNTKKSKPKKSVDPNFEFLGQSKTEFTDIPQPAATTTSIGNICFITTARVFDPIINLDIATEISLNDRGEPLSKSELCLKNSKTYSKNKMKYLASAWYVLSILFKGIDDLEDSSILEWCNPVAKSYLLGVLEMTIELHDISNTVLLCCALSANFGVSFFNQSIKVERKKSISRSEMYGNNGTVLNRNQLSNQSDDFFSNYDRVGILSPEESDCDESGMITCSIWGASYELKYFRQSATAYITDSSEHAIITDLADVDGQGRRGWLSLLVGFKVLYTDLLFAFGFQRLASEICKSFGDSIETTYRGLELVLEKDASRSDGEENGKEREQSKYSQSGGAVDGGDGIGARVGGIEGVTRGIGGDDTFEAGVCDIDTSLECFYCNELVTGLRLVCSKCFHGGHIDHVEKYVKYAREMIKGGSMSGSGGIEAGAPDVFKSMFSECPRGCGCKCFYFED
ncbi:Maintenance of telomere capping protein 5 [Smittium culicis]|uniref:Maintenance of telomere capping protein 5 n=1 Tax=Smittium culicis TaxID=133412 RepID=A0A1R1XSQ9_9FUNG|nr:Maintenance of telomere capping protein 5 [Smittium culicis]